MAISLNAQKGGIAVTNGYLLVTNVQMTKYLKPVRESYQETQADGTIVTKERVVMHDAFAWAARGQVYPSKESRDESFGAADLNFAFSFEHESGKDPVQEAYEYVKANGLRGWVLSDMVDA